MEDSWSKGVEEQGGRILEVEIHLRPSYDIDPTEPVAQNFYPVTSMITIRCLLVKHIQ